MVCRRVSSSAPAATRRRYTATVRYRCADCRRPATGVPPATSSRFAVDAHSRFPTDPRFPSPDSRPMIRASDRGRRAPRAPRHPPAPRAVARTSRSSASAATGARRWPRSIRSRPISCFSTSRCPSWMASRSCGSRRGAHAVRRLRDRVRRVRRARVRDARARLPGEARERGAVRRGARPRARADALRRGARADAPDRRSARGARPPRRRRVGRCGGAVARTGRCYRRVGSSCRRRPAISCWTSTRSTGFRPRTTTRRSTRAGDDTSSASRSTHSSSDSTPDRFVRVHRSAIVRLDRVREMRSAAPGESVLVLRDGTRVPVSRRRREQVAELIRRMAR